MNKSHRESISKFRLNRHGSIFIEIPFGLLFMIAMIFFAVDITLMIYGMALCDSTCRDCARAAGQENNILSAETAAQRQLQIHHTDGILVSQPVVTSFVYQDYGQAGPPLNQSPYVTVSTAVSVKVPSPVSFLGAKFLPGGYLQFTRVYTYPIVKVRFYG